MTLDDEERILKVLPEGLEVIIKQSCHIEHLRGKKGIKRQDCDYSEMMVDVEEFTYWIPYSELTCDSINVALKLSIEPIDLFTAAVLNDLEKISEQKREKRIKEDQELIGSFIPKIRFDNIQPVIDLGYDAS